jgi:adenylate cyclase
VSLLNEYFASREPIIKDAGGWINKFLGDGFMAVFGVLAPHPDHEKRTVQAAIAIREETTRFNDEHADLDFQIGIRIECGRMVARSIGSPDRVKYTVIGDAVNIAARIEELNKQFSTTILVSEGVHARSGYDGGARRMEPAVVKGIANPVQVLAL